VPGVHAELSLASHSGTKEVGPFFAAAGETKARGRIVVTRGEPSGVVLLEEGPLAWGLELEEGNASFELEPSRAWFDAAARRMRSR
jgi:hypothetical protein